MTDNWETYENFQHRIFSTPHTKCVINPSKHSVVLQTRVNGADGPCVTYDKTQLDKLIKMLQNISHTLEEPHV